MLLAVPNVSDHLKMVYSMSLKIVNIANMISKYYLHHVVENVANL